MLGFRDASTRVSPTAGSLMILDLARLLLFPALMAFAAASDLFTMTISNRVSLLLAAGFLVLAVASGMGLHDMLLHVAAGMVVLTVAFVCFTMGWVGGGDAKWRPGGTLVRFCPPDELSGLRLAVRGALTLLLLQSGNGVALSTGRPGWLLKLHAKESGIPYGIALAVGALMIYPETSG